MFLQNLNTARLGEEILPFECRNPPEFFRQKAEAELHDSPDKRIQGLQQIKELINKHVDIKTRRRLLRKFEAHAVAGDRLSLIQTVTSVYSGDHFHTHIHQGFPEFTEDKHTKHMAFEDDFLLQYLIGKKYNISKAFSCLKAIVHLKKKHPEIFSGFSYEEISLSMTEKVLTVLPWRCQDGCTIITAHLDNWDPEKLCMADLKRAFALYMLQSLREPMTQINGFKFIINAQSDPLKHLRYVTPSNLYLLYHATQECIPARYKEYHIVNESYTIKAAWFLVKPFLSNKIKKRIHFHNSNEALLKFFPKAILPVEFGGDLKNYEMYDWLRKVTELESIAGLPRET